MNHHLRTIDLLGGALLLSFAVALSGLWSIRAVQALSAHHAAPSASAAAAASAHAVAPPGSLSGLPKALVIGHTNSVRFWSVIDHGTLWTTTSHKEAHARFASHPGSIIWQVSVPQSTVGMNTNSCGTNLFGIVLCK